MTFPLPNFPGMILQVPRPGCVVWVTSSAQLHNYITPSTNPTVILTAHCRRRKLRFLTKLPFLGNVWCDIRKSTSFCLSFCPKKCSLSPFSLIQKSSQHATCLPCLSRGKSLLRTSGALRPFRTLRKSSGTRRILKVVPWFLKTGKKRRVLLKERDEVEWLLLGAGRKHRMFNFYTYLEPNDRPLFCGIDLHHFMGQIFQNMGFADPCTHIYGEDPIKAKSMSLLQMLMNSCPTGNQGWPAGCSTINIDSYLIHIYWSTPPTFPEANENFTSLVPYINQSPGWWRLPLGSEADSMHLPQIFMTLQDGPLAVINGVIAPINGLING